MGSSPEGPHLYQLVSPRHEAGRPSTGFRAWDDLSAHPDPVGMGSPGRAPPNPATEGTLASPSQHAHCCCVPTWCPTFQVLPKLGVFSYSQETCLESHPSELWSPSLGVQEGWGIAGHFGLGLMAGWHGPRSALPHSTNARATGATARPGRAGPAKSRLDMDVTLAHEQNNPTATASTAEPGRTC